jgi:uncharacterized protein (DUF2384 family)
MIKGDFAKDTVNAIAADVEAIQREYDAELSVLLNRLEALDLELAKQAIEVFGNRCRAAIWLAARRPCFHGLNPYQLIAKGKRQDVLDILGRIEHGIFS